MLILFNPTFIISNNVSFLFIKFTINNTAQFLEFLTFYIFQFSTQVTFICKEISKQSFAAFYDKFLSGYI